MQAGVGGFQYQMVMVAHQAPGMHLPAGFLARFGQGFDEIVPVHIVQKDVVAPVTPAHHTCPAVARVKADDTWHRDIQHAVGGACFLLSPATPGCQPKKEPCYGLTPFLAKSQKTLRRQFGRNYDQRKVRNK